MSQPKESSTNLSDKDSQSISLAIQMSSSRRPSFCNNTTKTPNSVASKNFKEFSQNSTNYKYLEVNKNSFLPAAKIAPSTSMTLQLNFKTKSFTSKLTIFSKEYSGKEQPS